jgi:membrane-associated protease RseP (regulator of RpoE activity)
MRCLLLLAAAAVAGAADDYDDESSRAGWGAFAVPPTLAEQAARDLVPGQGLVVLFVRPEGTADTLGIVPGDVVLAINDQPVSSRRDVRAVVRAAEAGDAVTVAVRSSSGDQAVRNGTFQERPPRPPGPPPWAMMGAWGVPPPGVAELFAGRDAAEQRRQLIAERDALATAAAELAAIPRPSPTAWFVSVVVR